MAGGLWVLTWLAGMSLAWSEPTVPGAWQVGVQALVDQRLTQGHFADAVVGVLSEGQTQIATWGLAQSNSIFEIGSITKTFTGILFADLVNEKVVKSTDTVDQYIPELKGTFAGSIRLEQLATHKSGLARVPGDLTDFANPYALYAWPRLFDFLQGATPTKEFVGAPSTPHYSNVGFALLGQILVIASKTSFVDLIHQRIAAPLGMTDTVLDVSGGDLQSRFLDGHSAGMLIVPHWNFDVFAPTGGLRSTLQDLVKFAQANLFCDESSLGRAIQLSQLNGWGWDSEILHLPFPYKNGQTGGFASAFFVDPRRKLAAVVLTNVAIEADSFVVPILKSLRH